MYDVCTEVGQEVPKCADDYYIGSVEGVNKYK